MVIRTLIRLFLTQRGVGSEHLIQRLSESPLIRGAARATAAAFLKSRSALSNSLQVEQTKSLVGKIIHLIDKWKKT